MTTKQTKQTIATFQAQMADVAKRESALEKRHFTESLALKTEAGGILFSAYVFATAQAGEPTTDIVAQNVKWADVTKRLSIDEQTAPTVWSRGLSTLSEDFDAFRFQSFQAKALTTPSVTKGDALVVPTNAKQAIVAARRLAKGGDATKAGGNRQSDPTVVTMLANVERLAAGETLRLGKREQAAVDRAQMGLPISIDDAQTLTVVELQTIAAIAKGALRYVRAHAKDVAKAQAEQAKQAEHTTAKTVDAVEQSPDVASIVAAVMAAMGKA